LFQDVIIRALKNEETRWLDPKDYKKLGLLRVVLLKEQSGQRILPIWVGPLEGDIIAMQLENISYPRPTTFDLTTRLLELGNTKIERVAVTSLRDNIYYAMMWINANRGVHEVDARPSDAIALALLMGCTNLRYPGDIRARRSPNCRKRTATARRIDTETDC
jgi:bifunctional DNase/RNase